MIRAITLGITCGLGCYAIGSAVGYTIAKYRARQEAINETMRRHPAGGRETTTDNFPEFTPPQVINGWLIGTQEAIAEMVFAAFHARVDEALLDRAMEGETDDLDDIDTLVQKWAKK